LIVNVRRGQAADLDRLAATAIGAALSRLPLEEAVMSRDMSGDRLNREVLTARRDATGGRGSRTTRVELPLKPVSTGENNDNTEERH
jgi:hypothetical protein